jgi:hypothetical protein
MKKEMWEILVPCKFEDNGNPVSTKHHQEWDKVIRNIAGGLTVLKPVKGQWVDEGKTYHDRIIPVRIMCNRTEIEKIVDFTINHYRQLAVMAYKISDEVILKRKSSLDSL